MRFRHKAMYLKQQYHGMGTTSSPPQGLPALLEPAVNVAAAMITSRDDEQRGGLRGPRGAVLRRARGGAERRLLGRRRAPSRSGASDSTTRCAVLCRQLPLPHGLHIDCISLLAQLCFGNCAILEQSITADPG